MTGGSAVQASERGADTLAAGPLVSIVTPTLNRATLLEHTLRSVRGQSYPRLEHIVMDGGSVDGTIDLLRRYEGTYDLRWVSQPDGGMYEAINCGMALATGDILAYLNSDDLYLPWTVEAVVRAFERRPDAAFVFGDLLNVDDRTGAARLIWQPPLDLDYLRRLGFLHQPAVFWRRSILDSGPAFDEGLRYVADCDFWMRAGATHRFVKVDEVLAVERDHPSTLRAQSDAPVRRELESVRRRYVSLVGIAHRRRALAGRIRLVAYWRAYWLRFAIAALLPARVRGASWRNVLADPRTRFPRVRAILLQLVPIRSRARSDRLLSPDRRWLEPLP